MACQRPISGVIVPGWAGAAGGKKVSVGWCLLLLNIDLHGAAAAMTHNIIIFSLHDLCVD